jgi:hypothetical protein
MTARPPGNLRVGENRRGQGVTPRPLDEAIRQGRPAELGRQLPQRVAVLLSEGLERAVPQLPDPLPRHAQHPADLLEGTRLVIV